ncbi:MAG TPA: ZIP family metal transporter [Pirellulales bacterium]|jgi:zinc and cadmium transporter|nr:ZIP family metal transporter [Pirellulales bacterium]
MTLAVHLEIYCVLVVAASLAGGWLPSLVVLSHRRMQMMISVVAGLMLGVALFFLLPHGAEYTGSLDTAILWMMLGLLVMFFLIRGFHAHHHEPIVLDAPQEPHATHDHHHGAPCEHDHGRPAGRRVGWIGIAAGLSLHTLLDGVALAAAVTADAETDELGTFAGFSTFLAVALHKPLDALSITTVMAAQGWSSRAQMVVNLLYSLMCPVGAAMFVFGSRHLGNDPGAVVGAALAFSAGVFLCISLADLLPEIEYHSHDRLKLSAALLVGVAIAYGIAHVEAHDHGAHPSSHHEMHGHDHTGHSQR